MRKLGGDRKQNLVGDFKGFSILSMLLCFVSQQGIQGMLGVFLALILTIITN